MKQILVATDFSKSTANAFAYALSMAKVLNMEVTAIHAIHPTEGINNSTYNAIFIESYYENKRIALEKWAFEIAKEKKLEEIPVKTLCDIGFLKTVIAKYTRSSPVELLIMGITGATGITGIVGSNAAMVVAKIRIPTLIVPIESNFPSKPVITLATDYETRLSKKDVQALNEMLKAAGTAKMQVIYVAENSNQEHIQSGEIRISNLLPDIQLNFNYSKHSSASTGIIDFIEQNHTDILCLVKHHHNVIYRLFTSSTVNKVMNRSLKAILILHE